jgi:predicted Zn-dependent protease
MKEFRCYRKQSLAILRGRAITSRRRPKSWCCSERIRSQLKWPERAAPDFTKTYLASRCNCSKTINLQRNRLISKRCNSLRARYPANPAMRLYLGRIFQERGSIGDARFQFNLGLGADPKNADLRLALADLEIMSGVPEAARADAQYLLRADPQNRGALEILNRTGGKTQPQ